MSYVQDDLRSQIRHLTAERDAWADIAREFLAIAHGLTTAERDSFTVPPVELRGYDAVDVIEAVVRWWEKNAVQNVFPGETRCPHCDGRYDGSME